LNLMRIAFTVHKLPPESLGGTEIYTRTLARVLAEAGHEVAIFAPSQNVTEATRLRDDDGVTRWLTPLPANRGSENAVAQYWHTFRDRAIEADFDRFLADTHPDVVHFQHVQGVSARLIEQAAGRPRIATLHDYWYFCANSQLIRPDGAVCAGPSAGCRNCVDCATARADLNVLRTLRPITALPLAYRNGVLARAAAQLDRLIAPSAFLRQQYILQGFPAERILVMENGLDADRLRTLPAPAPASPAPASPAPASPAPASSAIAPTATAPSAIAPSAIAPSSDRPLRFGFLGSLAWQKGVHLLVEAFNTLDPARATLDIYGSGSAFPDYAAALHSAIRNPAVTIHPPVAFDDVGRVLHTFDVLVVPSVWYENSPLVIQEAYAAGVPVLASRLGALEEKVTPGASGWHFAPGNSADLARVLHELVANPAQVRTRAATLPQPPTMREQAHELVALYASLLAAARRA